MLIEVIKKLQAHNYISLHLSRLSLHLSSQTNEQEDNTSVSLVTVMWCENIVSLLPSTEKIEPTGCCTLRENSTVKKRCDLFATPHCVSISQTRPVSRKDWC